ncbi:MAG: O-antigen ligase family protein [Trueperaceae bacterium]|nr:O-antigen ligase family protein [Trueperaceae bacterium]
MVPLLVAAILRPGWWQPYVSLGLGLTLGFVVFTISLAGQVLAVIALAGLTTLHAIRNRNALIQHVKAVAVRASVLVALVAVGFTFALQLVEPEAIQVLGGGVNLTDVREPEEEDLTKDNLRQTFRERGVWIADALRRGAERFPVGTGAGSTRHIFSSIQSHPGVESVDVHNYYVQTFMTLGPIGALALVWWLFGAVHLAFLRGRVALGVAGVLFAIHLGFDVAGYFPGVMMSFMLLAGAGAATEKRAFALPNGSAPAHRMLGLVALVAVFAFVAYWAVWSLPCQELDCALGRRLAERTTVSDVMARSTEADRLRLAAGAARLNPDSLAERRRFVHELETTVWRSGVDPLPVLREHERLVDDFRVADPYIYWDWIEAATRAGDREMACEARLRGWQVFGFRGSHVLAPSERSADAMQEPVTVHCR